MRWIGAGMKSRELAALVLYQLGTVSRVLNTEKIKRE